MIIVYFSGTGNSKYLAEQFAKRMNINAYSIEQNLDFETIFSHEDTIAFCYPIYGSCVPRIMREFVSKYKFYLNEKSWTAYAWINGETGTLFFSYRRKLYWLRTVCKKMSHSQPGNAEWKSGAKGELYALLSLCKFVPEPKLHRIFS